MDYQLLRRFTPEGVSRFEDFLEQLRKDHTLDPDPELLNDIQCTESVGIDLPIERPGFATKLAAAQYLRELLEPLHTATLFTDVGMWTWLALFYFDDVCPKTDGRRKPVANPHYILQPHNYRRRYRHLLATPLRLFMEVPDHNRIYLNAPLSVHGDLIEQTMGRLHIIRIPAVREVIDELYYDEDAGRAKRGIVNKTPKRGDLRSRLITRIQQLMLTFDVHSMTAEDLLAALGSEFEGWRPATQPTS